MELAQFPRVVPREGRGANHDTGMVDFSLLPLPETRNQRFQTPAATADRDHA